MKIFFLTTSYPRFDGDEAGIFVEKLAKSLAEISDQISVIVPQDSEEKLFEDQKKLKIYRFKYWLKNFNKITFGSGIMPNLRAKPYLALQIPFLLFSFFYQLLKRKNSYEIVLANWSILGGVASIAEIFTGKRFITILRGEDVRLIKFPILGLLISWLIKRGDRIVAVGKSIGNEASHLLQRDVTVIENGVDKAKLAQDLPDDLFSKYAIPNNVKYLIAIGTVIPRKRLEVVLEILSQAALNDLHLLVVGRKIELLYLSLLRDKVRKLQLEKRVHFLGAVSPDHTLHLLAKSELFISASSYEGRPNAVLEALVCGKITMLSDIPQHREIIETVSQDKALLSRLILPEEASQAALLIKKNLEDHYLREKFIELGKDNKRFPTWNDCAKSYMQEIRESQAPPSQ
jgi:glycosyltransferase involved in cell wall biosynthesis